MISLPSGLHSSPDASDIVADRAAVECTFDNSAGLEFCDIGANLTDRMYSGEYNGKQKHEPDLEAVVARAGAAGVRRLMITGGCLEDAGAALAMARSAGTDGAELFCTVGNPHEYPHEYFLRIWAASLR